VAEIEDIAAQNAGNRLIYIASHKLYLNAAFCAAGNTDNGQHSSQLVIISTYIYIYIYIDIYTEMA